MELHLQESEERYGQRQSKDPQGKFRVSGFKNVNLFVRLPPCIYMYVCVWEINLKLPCFFSLIKMDDLIFSYLPWKQSTGLQSSHLKYSYTSFAGLALLPKSWPVTWEASYLGVWLFATLWTVIHKAPLSTGFSRQESCSGLPHPLPGYLPDPGIKPRYSNLQADSLPSKPIFLNSHH